MNCLNCNTQTTNPKFCSMSCAATFNNKKSPKRSKVYHACASCGKEKARPRNKYCKDCFSDRFGADITLQEAMDRYSKHHRSSAFVLVRKRSREYLKTLPPEECVCQHCGYSKHVQVCHIRAVKDFPLNTKISVVNHPDNLLILCPNCHWEYDHPEK